MTKASTSRASARRQFKSVTRRYRYDEAPEHAVDLSTELEDNAVERALREATGVETGPFQPRALERVLELRVSGHHVTELSSLQALPKLERLWVRSRAARDLSAIGRLASLRELALTDVPADDLRPLQRLHRLERLRLENLPSLDLAPLSSLRSLEDLCVRRAQPRSVAPLTSLTRLRELELTEAVLIEDLSPLAALPQLRYLNVTGTRVLRLGALAKRAREGSLHIEGLECEPAFRVLSPGPVTVEGNPLRDARALRAEVARRADDRLRWPCSVQALLLDGEGASAVPDNPWRVPARATLKRALEAIWSPLERRAPAFASELADRTFGLALLAPLGDDQPAVAYLLRPCCGCHERQGFWLLVGHAPRDPGLPAVGDASGGFRLPLALRELYAVHAGLTSDEAELLPPRALKALTPLCRGRLDGFRKRNRGQMPDQYRVFLRDGDGGAKVLDLDRLDARCDPVVRRFYPETVEVDGHSTFWDWFEDEAPELLLHAQR